MLNLNRRRLLVASSGLVLAGGARLAAQGAKEIEIQAMKFEFTPDAIKVKLGQPVALLLTSIDRIHGFKMPSFGLRTDIVPGQTTRLAFTPDKAGQHTFFCDIFCGDGHEDMSGVLTVEA